MTTMPLSFKLALPFVALFGLAACTPMPATDAPPTLHDTVMPTSGIAGLTTREPTLFCQADRYTPYLGQPGSVIPGLGVDRTHLVVEFRGIEPQDYDPNRIIFRLDAAGNISEIDCG